MRRNNNLKNLRKTISKLNKLLQKKIISLQEKIILSKRLRQS